MYILKKNGAIIGRAKSKSYLNKRMSDQFCAAVDNNRAETDRCFFVNEYAKCGDNVWTIEKEEN